MANHILNALIERKRQLWAEIESSPAWKELEWIEAYEHKKAIDNSDSFNNAPKVLPKREPLPVQRKLAEPNMFNFRIKSQVKKASTVEEVIANAGGIQVFFDYAKRTTNNHLIRVTNQPQDKKAYLILVDGSTRTKSGSYKTTSIALFDTPEEAYDMREKIYDYLRDNWQLNANN
jgi:hypothetical protein